MEELYEIAFKGNRRAIYSNSQSLPLRTGDYVVVATERGEHIGEVHQKVDPNKVCENRTSLQIIRRATEEDLSRLSELRKKESAAFDVCLQKIAERDLVMKLVDVEYQFDGNKITFYFTAEKRVDFRELVKDLARELRTRIEMRQIGARDEARLVGGLGSCGLGENCSKKFLKELASVSVKTVKRQGLGMNLNRLSGMCGRLKCCLNFAASEDLDPSSRGDNCSGQCG